ncbi:DEP domain-containing protein 1A-like isoform X5 [Dreissena polymorpha]|uniref:DEP domain-containing protein 1A-like isoform X5 n=1 Tax=Dreissena polymorpha TaxID=45954 RepID=UPI0022655696|nr:DEP domain-containing protein 1A-like isoform X5 [Dreissena polymorpha]
MGEHITAGPYRATLLWNSLIRSFRNGIELGRHRRYMKTYDECFVASDAVEWMHQYLTENPNFGTDVSRAQAVQLLKKLHKSRLFEDVRGPKHNRGEFTDSSRLFRLTLASPSKSIRTPIALRNNLKLANLRRHTEEKTSHAEPVKLDFDRMSSLPSLHDNKTTLPECHFVTKPLTAQEIEEQWKLLTFESLEKILGVQGLDDIIEPRYVSGRNIMHNCLYINKSGVVTNIDPKDQLPHWALSAMKCLAYWPDKTDENLPNYPGFEKDVFRVVKDYFCGLKEPLMTYNMYEVITNVFGLTMDDCTERIVKALQLVCLLLPPANRRRLHLLLRLINKMATNDKLVLDKTQPLRLFLLETFSRAVLCCHDEGEMDDQLVIQLVAFLMDHYVDVFAVPIDLKTGVEARITKLQRTKVTRLRHDSNIYIRIRYASEDPATLHYCQKVSLDEYENQRLTASQQALATLLEEIIQDNSMSSKEKKKRLKQFQKMHPDIYLRRFPCSLSEPDLYPSQPRIKPPLLAKPLLKLKGLRL